MICWTTLKKKILKTKSNVILFYDEDEEEFDSISVDHNANISIELSSDEEADHSGQEVVLDKLKRPFVRVRRPSFGQIADPSEDVETLDILESDEEYPVCLVNNEKSEGINLEEKTGYVKEYIEREGLGMIYSKEHGLTIFNVASVWIDGKNHAAEKTRKLLPIGTSVRFYDRTMKGNEFEGLGGLVQQAFAVWVGVRPKHLLKRIDLKGPSYLEMLNHDCELFKIYFQLFLPVDLVRVRAFVRGFVTADIGILEVEDENNVKRMAFFHKDDALVFRKKCHQWRHVQEADHLPIGLAVTVDCRRLSRKDEAEMGGVEYQAMVVLAGSWPETPHPSLFPGGPGSHAPGYEAKERISTWYYMELELEDRLDDRVRQFKKTLVKGNIKYTTRNVTEFRTPGDSDRWRGLFTNVPRDKKRKREDTKRPVQHVFKEPLPRKLKLKEDPDRAQSDVASVGGSRSGWSGVELHNQMNSPKSKSSKRSKRGSSTRNSESSTGTGTSCSSKRSWYGEGPGFLQIKKEVKMEIN